MNQTYLIINESTNFVDDVVSADETWQPPAGHIAVPQDTTVAIDWVLNDEDTWVQAEVVGAGKQDFTWDSATQKLTTNRPPPLPRKV
jgi:hypothetical protein